MLQSRRRRWWWQLEVQSPRWEAGAAGAGKGAWGAGAQLGLLQPRARRGEARGSERAGSTQAPCSGWPSAEARRGSSPQPAPTPPGSPGPPAAGRREHLLS